MSLGGSQPDKAGWAGQTDRRETWEQFDWLPRPVKQLFWAAPYEYTARQAFDYLARGGVDVRGQVLRQLESMQRDVGREALRLYGPHHPQAARS